MNLNKIKKNLIPTKPDLHKRWWHRLISVLIYGSTITFFIFSLVGIAVLIGSKDWKIDYYIYNFEDKYLEVKGKERTCSFYTGFTSPIINCGDLKNSTDFLEKINRTNTAIESLKILRETRTDDEIVKEIINTRKVNDKISYKVLTTIKYKTFSLYLLYIFGSSIFLSIIWFIIWESVIYRTLLYIIYGRKNE